MSMYLDIERRYKFGYIWEAENHSRECYSLKERRVRCGSECNEQN